MSIQRERPVRVPVPDERREATLRVGDVCASVRLVDESAGGYGLWVDEADASLVHVDQTVLIGVDQGWSEGRVANIQPGVGGVFVGFERQRELTDLWEESPSDVGQWTMRSSQPKRLSGGLRGYAVLVGIVLVAASYALLRRPAEQESAPPRGRSARARSTENTLSKWAPLAAGSANESDPGFQPIEVGAETSRRASRAADDAVEAVANAGQTVADGAAETAERVADAAAPVLDAAEELLAAVPQWAETLDLSSEQRSRILAIVEESRAAIGRVYRQTGQRAAQDIAAEVAELRRQAAAAVLGELTPDQTERFKDRFNP